MKKISMLIGGLLALAACGDRLQGNDEAGVETMPALSAWNQSGLDYWKDEMDDFSEVRWNEECQYGVYADSTGYRLRFRAEGTDTGTVIVELRHEQPLPSDTAALVAERCGVVSPPALVVPSHQQIEAIIQAMREGVHRDRLVDYISNPYGVAVHFEYNGCVHALLYEPEDGVFTFNIGLTEDGKNVVVTDRVPYGVPDEVRIVGTTLADRDDFVFEQLPHSPEDLVLYTPAYNVAVAGALEFYGLAP